MLVRFNYFTQQPLIALLRVWSQMKMNFEKEKEILKAKYSLQREWMQSTPTYGCWVYPTAYYMELVDLVRKHSK